MTYQNIERPTSLMMFASAFVRAAPTKIAIQIRGGLTEPSGASSSKQGDR